MEAMRRRNEERPQKLECRIRVPQDLSKNVSWRLWAKAKMPLARQAAEERMRREVSR